MSKNGILIVQFANQLQGAGRDKLAAVIEAAATRLRPILMTTAATVVGHFPLVLATGPGAGARNSIGIMLVSGMIIGTVFTLFVVPSIYVLLARSSVASTEFTDAGLPILKGDCAMHRQASFYAANWPEGTDVSEGGDAFAFYLPPASEEFGSPVLGGGEFVTAFSDAIEVQALMTYISGGEWVNEKGKATPNGGFVSANKNLDIANVASPIDKTSVEILQNPDAVCRFDGSDLMPGAVGAGSFWKGMTAWIGGGPEHEGHARLHRVVLAVTPALRAGR